MRRIGAAATAMVLAAVGPASAVTFTESFSSGWFGSPDTAGASFSLEGVLGATGAATLDVKDFAAADAKLGAPGGSPSGGFYYEKGVSGNGAQWDAGDNQMVYLDYHMPVPNGVYTFNVGMDAQINWSNQDQPWGRGYEFYIGDASSLAYGTQTPHNAPTGPWQGKNWNGGANTQGTTLIPGAANGTYYNGADENDVQNPNLNGNWKIWSLSAKRDGSTTINVTTGEVILRIALRLKNANQSSPKFSSWAFDNLNVSLVPEPASAGLLALGLLPLLRRRRRSV